MAGHVTTFFGYSRGLNDPDALVVTPFDTPEMIIKQAVSSTRGIIDSERIVKTSERVAVGSRIQYCVALNHR